MGFIYGCSIMQSALRVGTRKASASAPPPRCSGLEHSSLGERQRGNGGNVFLRRASSRTSRMFARMRSSIYLNAAFSVPP
jgi:hypothetical protein